MALVILGAMTSRAVAATSPAPFFPEIARVDPAAVGEKLKTETFRTPAGSFEIQIRAAGIAIVLPDREVMTASRAELERFGYEVTGESLIDLAAPAASRDVTPIEAVLTVAHVRLDDKQLDRFRDFLNGESVVLK